MGLARDGAHIVISSLEPDGPPGSRTVQIYVDDVFGLRDELIKAGVRPRGEVLDQDWGNLEIGVVDPDGNGITFSQEKGV